MRVVAGSQALGGPLRRGVVTVGNFDGLHVGHREILRIVTERARARGGEAAVYTFEPHPRKVLRPDAAPKLLTTLEQKLELIEAAGVDVAVVEPFDRVFAGRSAVEFVRDVLHERLEAVQADAGGRPVAIRETDKLTGTFASTGQVAAVRDDLETWSRLVFDALTPHKSAGAKL